MAQPRTSPPPVPPRVDLGETEESALDSQEHVAVSAQPPTDFNGPEIAKPEPVVNPKIDYPVVTPKSSSNISPNASKPINIAPLPVGKSTKPVPKKEAKGRPTISIISVRPMDQTSSLPSVQFKNDKAELTTQEGNVNNNQQSANAEVTAQVPKRPPGLNKPSKPAPLAPRKLPPKLEDRSPKPADTSKKMAPVPNLRSKTKTSKRDSGSVFYIDTSSDSAMDTKSSSTPTFDNSSNKTVQKPKQVTSQPNVKSKSTFPAPRKPKTRDEQKASDIDPVVNTKVKPPDKVVSKPKLKPTIITAKTPKQQGKADEVKISLSKNMNTSSITKTADDDRPSRPSFPPSATTDELNKNESQPERPKAPPNTIKEEERDVEMKREQKKGEKNVQSEKKRPKSKPARPPMTKDSARLKPSRPPPAKPKVTRKSSSKTNDVSNSEKSTTDKSALVQPSGPPRAQAKFDSTGETDDDLTFKAGDTIMLTSKVDNDWLVGYLENNVMHQGLFPSSFVEIIVAVKEQPNKEPNKKEVPSEPYATALHDFEGQSEAELSFSSGETIILLERINVEWLKGKLNNSIGIFPANFVQIKHDLPVITNQNHVVTPAQTHNSLNTKASSEEWCQAIHDYQGEHTDDLSFVVGTKIKIIERVSQDWFKGEYSGKSGIFPASFVQVISEVSKTCQDFSLVTAVHDYPGENANDLSFKTGDKIKVIERINSDWLMGECNGKQGLFPASFVEGLQSESSSVIQASDKEKEQTKDFLMTQAIHEFSGENPGELHFSIGDVIQVLREIDSNWSEGRINDVSGIFPTAFVEIQRPASKVEDVYAKALYDFAGESEHDLSFKAGDTIQILEHVNDDWCLGSIGGKTGHFPSSFVQILSLR